MADKRRFDVFAEFLKAQHAPTRVFDVAGGQGALNQALVARGIRCTTFDLRHKRLPVDYAMRPFTLDEPADGCDLVVGLHADGATRLCIEYAQRHHIAFAVVPCCSDNGMPFNPWRKFLGQLARDLGCVGVQEADLGLMGRSTVIHGTFAAAGAPGAVG